MSDPSPWLQLAVEAVAAVGSVAAVGWAVYIASRERRDRIAAQAETRALRDRERRGQAARISASVKPQRRSSMSVVSTQVRSTPKVATAAWSVLVHNGSAGPIRNVTCLVSVRGQKGSAPHTITIGEIVASSDGTARGDYKPEIVGAEPAWVVYFTDEHSVRWSLDESSRLHEVGGS